MYSSSSTSEVTINIIGNTTEYIIGNLTSSTNYDVSVLAYTIGDGPRSIYLTGITNDQDACKIIVIS